MTKQWKTFLPGLAVTVFYISFFVFMFAMSPVQHRFQELYVNIYVCYGFTLLIYGINTALLRKNLSVPVISAVLGLELIVDIMIFRSITVMIPTPLRSYVFFFLLFAALPFVSLYMAWMQLKPQSVWVCFDLEIAMIALLFVAQRFQDIGLFDHAIVSMCFTLLVLMATMIYIRTGQAQIIGDAAGGKKLIYALSAVGLIGFGALLAVLAPSASRLAGHGAHLLQETGHGISRILSVIYDYTEAFFLWLFSLFSFEQVAEEEDDIASAVTATGTAEEIGQMQVPTGVIVLIAAAFVLLLIYMLYKLRRKTVSAQTMEIPFYTGEVIRSSTRPEKKSLWQRLIHRMRLHWQTYQYRHTPEALYLYVEKQLRKQFRKEAAQSPVQYLQAACARYDEMNNETDSSNTESGNSEKAAALLELAKQLELSLYRDQASNHQPELYQRIHKIKNW